MYSCSDRHAAIFCDLKNKDGHAAAKGLMPMDLIAGDGKPASFQLRQP